MSGAVGATAMRHQNLLSLIAFGAALSGPALVGCALASSEPAEDVASAESALGNDGGAGAKALVEVTGFGSNPGALKMLEYVPSSAPATGASIVVVLHGCSQGAADVAKTGWNDLADEKGFIVVYPEQVTANNQARCFNWGGVYGDLTNIQRGKGENQSIKEMIDKELASKNADPQRVFVVGFSAGGALAAIMAATWPEVFSAGATIAGIPYHCNTTFAEAFSCQKPGKDKTPAQWAALAKEANAGYTGAFPRMSIWQGANDTIVGPANRSELVEQWTEVHGVGQTPSATDTTLGANHSVFKDKAGKVVVETYEVPDMDHGVAVDPSKKCGTVAQNSYAIDKGLCTAAHVVSFFGLDAPSSGGADGGTKPPTGPSSSSSSGSTSSSSSGDTSTPPPASGAPAGGSGAAPAPAGDDGSAGSTCSFGAARSSERSTTTAAAIVLAGAALASIVARRGGRRLS